MDSEFASGYLSLTDASAADVAREVGRPTCMRIYELLRLTVKHGGEMCVVMCRQGERFSNPSSYPCRFNVEFIKKLFLLIVRCKFLHFQSNLINVC